MANQYTPDEIQDIFDRYHKAIADGTTITKEMAEELADAKKGIKNYTFTLNQSLKQLGQTTKQTIGNIANGAKGVSVFNDNLSAAADTASTAAASFGPLGVAVGLVVKALTFFVTTATKQSDKLFESFQTLSKSGSVGAQGMTDVFQSMKRFGYTIDELDKMTAVLAENSRDFAMFSGTAATGGKQLSQLVEGFQDVRVNLQAMGVSTDDQVRGAAGLVKQLGRMGRAADATSAGVVGYIKNMDAITRLTGIQRAELEAQREQSETIDEFYAALADMDPKAAENTREVFDRLYAINPARAMGFAKSLNGIIDSSAESMQYQFATNFQAIELGNKLREGQLDASQYLQATGEEMGKNFETAKSLAKVGVTDLYGRIRDFSVIGQKTMQGFANSADQARGEMNGLYNMMDPATKAQAQARVAQINSSNSMQSFVNLGVAPATQALAYLAETVESLTSLLPGSKSTTGYGRGGTGTLGKSLASTAAGAAAGSVFGPVGTVIGGIAGYAGYELGGGGGLTGKTSGLDPAFMKKLQGAANEYQSLTGQSLNIVSGNRTSEEQAKLYADFQAGRSRFPAAPPGQSRHESGRAVDVSLDAANKLDSMGLLQKYGLSRPVAGDPIHIQGASGFRGSLSGPMSGYSPNVLMHGNEELSIRPAGGSSNSNSGASEGTMMKLIERVDDLIYLNKSQLSTAEKMLKYQQ